MVLISVPHAFVPFNTIVFNPFCKLRLAVSNPFVSVKLLKVVPFKLRRTPCEVVMFWVFAWKANTGEFTDNPLFDGVTTIKIGAVQGVKFMPQAC